jgi:serine phosphatase RsbU (regulator of sigma subunit)/anti-sigma regulatory factor (Ser/Thr protein kinase)
MGATAGLQPSRWCLGRQGRNQSPIDRPRPDDVAPTSPTAFENPPVDIAPQDPLLAYLQSAPEPVETRRLQLASPALTALRDAGVEVLVPLVAHGQVVGIINLGPRLSEQDYSAEDRRLLTRLADQAAPALRVAQLVREQKAEVQRRERFQQEMELVQLVQQNFLPQRLPDVDDWRLDAIYRPAQEVGGDFYDVIELDDGQLGMLVADVTDKGMAAGFVMASARSILRAAVQRLVEPRAVLRRANDQLQPDMPPNMFVTCLYGVLDPSTGRFRFANAGHNLPCVQTADGAVEVRATGMPLGLMPDMDYEEAEVTVEPGRALLLYSDAIPEAHSPDGEMFSFGRLVDTVGQADVPDALIPHVLDTLAQFTGDDWEQEDDITVVAAYRLPAGHLDNPDSDGRPQRLNEVQRHELDRFTVPGDAPDERAAMERVADTVGTIGVEPTRLDNLCTAVAEAVMNAVEHGNAGRADLPVDVRVMASDDAIVVKITDHGAGEPVPDSLSEPDLAAKLRGEQSPRGWGLFLIRELLDDLRIEPNEVGHTVSLVLARNGDPDA